MEFSEKLQELRRRKGLTQEALAEVLFVSRTAVSKWESGRGYPNIDSLKAIAKYFNVSVDTLLSGEELLAVAQEETVKTENRCRDLVFGLLDLGCLLLLFLPLFGQRTEGAVQAVSLLSLTAAAPWLKVCYFSATAASALWGILTLALQCCGKRLWLQSKVAVSLLLNGVMLLLLIVSMQPYGAVLLLSFLSVKVIFLLKKG